jgi:hypothetical protein
MIISWDQKAILKRSKLRKKCPDLESVCVGRKLERQKNGNYAKVVRFEEIAETKARTRGNLFCLPVPVKTFNADRKISVIEKTSTTKLLISASRPQKQRPGQSQEKVV